MRQRAARSRPQEMTLVDTPNAKTIAELVEQFDLPIEKTVKTLLVKAVEGSASRWLPCWCAAITS